MMIRQFAFTFVICLSALGITALISPAQSQRDREFQDQGFDTGGSTGRRGQQTGGYTQDTDINITPQQRRCMSLEKQLAQLWIAKSQSRKDLPKLDDELRKWDSIYLKAKAQADRSRCYKDLFIFGKELRNTRKCQKLGRQIEEAKATLQNLQNQKRAVTTNDTREEDHLISILAREGCGSQYEKEDRKRNRFTFLFGGRDDDDRDKPQGNGIMPFATYRTMCVRTCDGFYFPVSFSTLPSRFPIDAGQCQSKCAAPAELYVYKNPGENIEQMVSVDGQLYSEAPYAFRYRKEYVKGCSCKQEEFSPEALGLVVEKDKTKNSNNNQSQQAQSPSQNSENKRKKIDYIE